MRAYRTGWRTMIAIAAIAALVAGGSSIGWFAILVAVGAIATGGATIAYAWVEEPRLRRRAVGELAMWFGIGAALILGLPVLIGPWWPLVPAVLALSSPRAVDWYLGHRRRSRPLGGSSGAQQLPTRDLEARWLRTTRDLRARSGEPATVLSLVLERELLLDELERRDPLGFHALLVRSGWRERQDW